MAYNLLITDNSSNELNSIVNYISDYLDNLSAASDFLDLIEECYERLATNPKIYQLCDHPNFKEKGYRKVNIKNYVLIYRIAEDTDTVYILHIFFGKQDYYTII